MKQILFFYGVIIFSFKLSAQEVVDTIQYSTDAMMFINSYDDNRVLRLHCTYLPSENNKLINETVFSANGKLLSSRVWYGKGQQGEILKLNSTSGKMDGTKADSVGRITEVYESSDSLSDACFMSFYPTGTLLSEGFQRIAKTFWVNHIDSITIGSIITPFIGLTLAPMEVKTGQWFYYYVNGNDSAVGEYFPIAYYVSDTTEHHSNGPGTFEFTLVTAYYATENKDGTWKYFSPDGKLIRTEEWNKGNLLKRETF